MKIRFGERILDKIDMENEEYKYSNLYDVELHSFNMQIQVKGSSLDKFKKVLEECRDGGIYKLDENNEVIGEYKVHSKSYSYNGNIVNENTVYNYSLNLEQVVNRKLESIKIDTLTVIPYEYKEEDDDDAIIVTAKIKLSKEEMKIFKSIEYGERYFDVIRYGISDKIVKMRFGKNIWSEHDDIFKVSIVLVEEVYDQKNDKYNGMLQPEMGNIMNMLAYQRNLNNELINILLTKNIVNEEDVNSLKSKAEKEINESYRLFYKTEDADRFK